MMTISFLTFLLAKDALIEQCHSKIRIVISLPKSTARDNWLFFAKRDGRAIRDLEAFYNDMIAGDVVSGAKGGKP